MVLLGFFTDPNSILDALVALTIILAAVWQCRKWFNEQRTKGYCALITRIVTNETAIESLNKEVNNQGRTMARIEGILMRVLRKGNIGTDDIDL
jgi:hypothetical protein